MKNFNYPAAPNTESFVGKSNRQIIEQEEANESAEPASEEALESDESGPVTSGGLTAPSGPGY